jgi:hypothetical protein
MKKVAITLFAAILAFNLSAQESTFEKGDKALNLGIGFGTSLYSGSYYKASVPPVSASFEVGIIDGILDKATVGVGGYIGYAASKYEVDYGFGSYGWKYSYTVIGARGTFHYPLVDKLDTYGGAMVGYNIVTSKEIGDIPSGYSSSGSAPSFSIFVGGRYYFTENIAAMAELGYGIAYFNIGLAMKF